MVSRSVLKNANVVISLTEDMKGEIQRICNRDVWVIPNGIDLQRFQNLPTKESIRSRLRLDNDEKIILFVGTLRPVEGVKYLIEAMNIIKQQNTTARLMLVGDGEERQGLEGLVKELKLGGCVTFVGKVPNERVPAYMAAADIFVLPTLSESFGIVNLEAMAAGLPVVASRVGGLPEIIEEGENGFLVEPKKPEQIADRVLMLLSDAGLRQNMAQSNRNKARRYSWQNTVGQLEALYRRLLEVTNRKEVTC